MCTSNFYIIFIDNCVIENLQLDSFSKLNSHIYKINLIGFNKKNYFVKHMGMHLYIFVVDVLAHSL